MRHTARLTMAWLLVPVLSLFCLPISGSRSDTKGNDVGLGCGSKSCQTFPHSIGFSGGRLSSYVEGSSALDCPLIHDAQSQDPS